MRKTDPTEKALERLAELRFQSDRAVLVVELRRALKDRSNLVVSKGEGGEMLLRYKARIGDADPQVAGECLTALLEANFGRSLFLLREMLESESEETASAAVFALGGQRRAEAFALLREKWERTAFGDIKGALLTAMAMARLQR